MTARALALVPADLTLRDVVCLSLTEGALTSPEMWRHADARGLFGRVRNAKGTSGSNAFRGAIARACQEGLLERARSVTDSGRRLHVYALTGTGRNHLMTQSSTQTTAQSTLFGALPSQDRPGKTLTPRLREMRSYSMQERSRAKVQDLLEEAKELAEANPENPDWAHRHTLGVEKPYMYQSTPETRRVFVSATDRAYPYGAVVQPYADWGHARGLEIEVAPDTAFGKVNAVSLRFRPQNVAPVATREPPRGTGKQQRRTRRITIPPVDNVIAMPRPDAVAPESRTDEPLVALPAPIPTVPRPSHLGARVDWVTPITFSMGEHDRAVNAAIESELFRVGSASAFEENEHRIDQGLRTALDRLSQPGRNVRWIKIDLGGRPVGAALDHPQCPYGHIARRYLDVAGANRLTFKTKITDTGYNVCFRVG